MTRQKARSWGPHPFEGGRVRLSRDGRQVMRRSPPDRVGTVLSVNQRGQAYVLWDGLKYPGGTLIALKFIETVPR